MPLPRTVETWGRIAPLWARAQELAFSARAAFASVISCHSNCKTYCRNGALKVRTLPSIGEGLAGAVHQRISTLGLRKKVLLVTAAGLAGSSLLLPLLGINLRDEETSELDSSAVGSASPHQINFEERFAIHLVSSPPLETMRQTNTEMTAASVDNRRTAGLSRESIPLPRPRRPR
jgi:hypothetical protein